MNVMIDNNVAIDALRPNPDFETDAKNVFRLIWQDKITPYMCVNSLTDIFYILKKGGSGLYCVTRKKFISSKTAFRVVLPCELLDIIDSTA